MRNIGGYWEERPTFLWQTFPSKKVSSDICPSIRFVGNEKGISGRNDERASAWHKFVNGLSLLLNSALPTDKKIKGIWANHPLFLTLQRTPIFPLPLTLFMDKRQEGKAKKCNFSMIRIHPSWHQRLKSEFEAPYFQELSAFVRTEYASTRCFPPASKVFAAFDHCPFDEVKVVILGQDPYHEPGQAEGLCFSVPDGVAKPPSLLNIFKEIESDLGTPSPESGSLLRWADQGVLLLNATLTVRAHRAGSHQGRGWELFTDAAVRRLAEEREGLVFILWGSYAQKKGAFIDTSRHLVLKSAHPSPLSAYRGFFGNHHFSRANAYLCQNGKSPIVW